MKKDICDYHGAESKIYKWEKLEIIIITSEKNINPVQDNVSNTNGW